MGTMSPTSGPTRTPTDTRSPTSGPTREPTDTRSPTSGPTREPTETRSPTREPTTDPIEQTECTNRPITGFNHYSSGYLYGDGYSVSSPMPSSGDCSISCKADSQCVAFTYEATGS